MDTGEKKEKQKEEDKKPEKKRIKVNSPIGGITSYSPYYLLVQNEFELDPEDEVEYSPTLKTFGSPLISQDTDGEI